jgi:hypothetical protein
MAVGRLASPTSPGRSRAGDSFTLTPSLCTSAALNAVCSYTTPPAASNLVLRRARSFFGFTPTSRHPVTHMSSPPWNPTRTGEYWVTTTDSSSSEVRRSSSSSTWCIG